MTLYRSGMGGHFTFTEFLERMGLQGDTKAAPANITKEQAVAKAEKIRNAAAKKKSGV